MMALMFRCEVPQWCAPRGLFPPRLRLMPLPTPLFPPHLPRRYGAQDALVMVVADALYYNAPMYYNCPLYYH